jgi:regulator of sirC expression with transglutaminase-like and TPR domain
MEPSESPDRVISAINRAMFDVCGLHGNRESYYDPRNSFLDQVFRRRTGLPITLSVIYMEVGRRLDFDVFGVGLPGHFVVKYYRGKREVFVDPFHEGRILNRQGCRRLIKTLHGRPVELRDLDFAACDKRSIVLRMCRNLRDVYLSTRQYRRGIEIVDAILALEPEDFEDLKVRAWINYELGRRKQSLDDLERYRAAGGGADLEDVDRWERNLRQALAQMN